MRVIGLALTGLALLGLAGAAPAPGTVLAQLVRSRSAPPRWPPGWAAR